MTSKRWLVVNRHRTWNCCCIACQKAEISKKRKFVPWKRRTCNSRLLPMHCCRQKNPLFRHFGWYYHHIHHHLQARLRWNNCEKYIVNKHFQSVGDILVAWLLMCGTGPLNFRNGSRVGTFSLSLTHSSPPTHTQSRPWPTATILVFQLAAFCC